MARIIRKQENKPIYVSVFGTKASSLLQHQQALTATGCCLDFPTIPLELSIKDQPADIYIVDLIEIKQSQSLFQSETLPYLIYGLDDLPVDTTSLELLYNAVGYLADMPSVNSIRLNVQLGLQRFRERQNYSRRVQDISEKIENNRLIGIATGLLISKTGLAPEEVFEQLKQVSRNKQRRAVDVAEEIILALAVKENGGQEIVRDGAIDNLAEWFLKR